MQNGMEINNISYHLYEGSQDPSVFQLLDDLYHRLFDDADSKLLNHRLSNHSDIIILTATAGHQLVGMKIGYKYDDETFYSWLGGVDEKFRRHGIASKLAEMQEEAVVKKGYTKLRTKSMNRFKPMMALNLKNGFDIVQVYSNEYGQRKIVFEKSLT